MDTVSVPRSEALALSHDEDWWRDFSNSTQLFLFVHSWEDGALERIRNLIYIDPFTSINTK